MDGEGETEKMGWWGKWEKETTHLPQRRDPLRLLVVLPLRDARVRVRREHPDDRGEAVERPVVEGRLAQRGVVRDEVVCGWVGCC